MPNKSLPLLSPPLCPDRSGSPLDEECNASAHKLSATAKQYLLIDTNVALHQVGHWGRRRGEGRTNVALHQVSGRKGKGGEASSGMQYLLLDASVTLHQVGVGQRVYMGKQCVCSQSHHVLPFF